MKRIFSSCLVCLCAIALCDVTSAATGRVGVYSNPTSRMPTMAVQTIGVTTAVSNIKDAPLVPEVKPDDTPDEQPEIDMRERERAACINNNIGIGNTFVWVSRYSDINNYATMVEDVEQPENNTCFVLVDLKSADSRIDLSDIKGKYFEMGRNITCGSWVDESDIEKRILDAKKKNRTLATIGGAVGGAALGVGSMELFGNRLIGGALMGQKAGTTEEQFKVYVANLPDAEHAQLVQSFQEMYETCESWQSAYGDKPTECSGLVVDDKTTIPYSELKDL